MNAEVTALRRGVTTPRRLLAALVFLTIGLALATLQLQPVSAQDKEKKVDASIEQGMLVVTGTADADTITLRLRAGHPETLEVDDGGHGGMADIKIMRDRFDAIVVSARDGNDQVVIDESNGVFTDTHPTTLNGEGGDDRLLGGAGAETLIGGVGVDQAFGGAGDDRMIWNPGDGTDLNEGGTGNDTAEVNGGNVAEVFSATANGTRVRFDRTSPAPFAIDIGTTEDLVLNASGGNDSFSATGDLAPLIRIRVDGGPGNDTLLGGNGVDALLGGDGNDFVDGNQGNETAFLGDGDDVFQWDPGDGSDTLEGGPGTDTMLFNGAPGAETFDLSANGGRLRFVRTPGNIVMDTDDVEIVDLNALGGVDSVTVNDLAATDVTAVNVDLASPAGTGTGDGVADLVKVLGTAGVDTITVAGNASGVTVTGLAATVGIVGLEAANDTLQIDTLGGVDNVGSAGLAPGTIALVVI
ncbi:MAG: calcium-binding protein [Dehalococcoidia bacterium]